MFQGGIPMKKIGDRNKEASAFPIEKTPIPAIDLEKYMDPMPPAAPVSTPSDITNGESVDPLSLNQAGFDFNALFQIEPNPVDFLKNAQANGMQTIEVPANGATFTVAPAPTAPQTAAKPATTGKATTAPTNGKTTAPTSTASTGNHVGSFTNGAKPAEQQQATVPTETPKP
jgi:hypothetical protein